MATINSRRFHSIGSIGSGSDYEPTGAYTYGIYDVVSTTEATKVIKGASYYGVDFQMSDILQMWVDGVEVTPSSTYTFDSLGRHVVEFDIPTIQSLSGMWYDVDRVVEIYYQTSTFLASSVGAMGSQVYRVFSGNDMLERVDFTNCDLSAMTNVVEFIEYGTPKLLMQNLVGFGNQLGNCTIMTYLVGSAYNINTPNAPTNLVISGWRFGSGPLSYDGLGYANVCPFAYCNMNGTLDLRNSDISQIKLMSNFLYYAKYYDASVKGIDTIYMEGPLRSDVSVQDSNGGTLWRTGGSTTQWWTASSGTFYYDINYESDYQKLIDVMPSTWTAETWN